MTFTILARISNVIFLILALTVLWKNKKRSITVAGKDEQTFKHGTKTRKVSILVHHHNNYLVMSMSIQENYS